MRLLILGCNQMAINLVPDLVRSGFEITILGKDRECLEAVANEPQVRVVLTTEPMMRDYLQQGGINNADVFLALSGDDHENALVAQIARHIFNVPKVICHLDTPQLQILYAGLGLDVVGYSFGLDVVGYSFGLLQDIQQAIER